MIVPADLDATALAALVRRREVKATELVDAAIERIEAENPRLNAVIWTCYDEARRAAEGPPGDGPFAGVPFLVKAYYPQIAGAPCAQGSRLGKAIVTRADSELVRRYRAAGLLVLGLTNVPELGLLPTTEPVLHGPCRNPWDPSRTPGGSSGGSAAAVAAGWVPMAHGSDGGGSIRIPAACCGLFGLKPTRGRNPFSPMGDNLDGLGVEHALTRSVRDSAALLDATLGWHSGDPYTAPAPSGPYAAEVGRPPGRLRVAVARRSPTGTPVHSDCLAAVDATARLLESLGHHVEEGWPTYDVALAARSFGAIWSAGVLRGVRGLEALAGAQASMESLEPLTWALYEKAQRRSLGVYLSARAALEEVGRAVAAFFEEHDVLLTPATAEPPVPLGTFEGKPGEPLAGMVRAAQFTPFTAIANVSGQPAMSLPLAESGGLPVGVQLIGRFAGEATLFRLAAELEAARPWAGRRPPRS